MNVCADTGTGTGPAQDTGLARVARRASAVRLSLEDRSILKTMRILKGPGLL